ncbi:SDR family NAD(P)-dependent oxidoreductase [uncultured Friedmanniella sp.]|uniref:SDR family NAD(P)-dependent oxidoreductase n=1 Tax=uncultured Friedmanniella sp. TaxID=335381 RepID=UPI0035CC9053
MPKNRWTESQIPDQRGRVAVVTGANTGIGLTTARALAAHHASVVLAVRDGQKGQAAAAQILSAVPDADVSVQALDLSSLASIREASAALSSAHPTIDLLINNAGVMYTPLSRTADGFELQFGTNHLGHFALTGLLLRSLLAAPASRVVTVSSVGHRIRAAIHFDDLQFTQSYDRVAAYGQAKLANLLFTYELQRRLAAIGAPTTALAAHPGVAATELGRNSQAWVKAAMSVFSPLLQTPQMGALPTLRAATDPTATGGQYYGPGGLAEARGNPVVVASSPQSHDAALQARLWSVSEELTGVDFAALGSVSGPGREPSQP